MTIASGWAERGAVAGRLGVAVHRLLGTAYGVLAAALVRRGTPPLRAGLTVTAVAWAVVDEGTALPLATSYPLVSHARGVVGHASMGLAIGAVLAVLETVRPRSPRRRRTAGSRRTGTPAAR